MAQYDLYANSNPETSETIPYLLDVQADLLDNLATRVVVTSKGIRDTRNIWCQACIYAIR